LEKELNEKLRIKTKVDSLKKIVGEDAEAKLKAKKELLEKIVREIESTKIRIEDLQNIIAQLSSLEGKCPVCESKLTKAKKKSLIKQKETEIKKLKEDLKKISKQKQLSEKELKELEEATDKLEKMLIEIKDLDAIQTELENSKNIFLVVSETSIKLDNELSSVKIELENLQEKLKGVTDEKQKLEILLLQLREYEDRKKRIDDLFKQREEILKHLAETESKISGRELEKQESEFMNLVAKEKEIATKIVGLDQIFEEKETRLKELEQTLASTLKEKEEIVKLEKLIQDLKIFEKALEYTQAELRREFVTAVNYTMNQLWSTLYPYQDFPGIGLTIEEGDYVLQLQDRTGRFVNAEGIASGGERSIACLALRIAFALVLAPQLRIAFLDEPSHNLDSVALKELAITLRERVCEFLDQIFLITHEEELIDAVTGKSYKLERDKTVDGITKIVSLE
jgi:exonuclease SbcC